MSDTIVIRFRTRLVHIPHPNFYQILRGVPTPKRPNIMSQREIEIAERAYRLGAEAAAEAMLDCGGARLERDLMGESEL